ncbi:MAG: hypothetical protein WCC22_14050 [Terriglobales bacterium]
MSWHKCVFPVLLAGIVLSSALAQVPAPQPPQGGGTTPPRRGGPTTNHPRREPCWEVAGISKTVIEQRQALARQARQEIESVCANSSLSIQQKRERIRAIHLQEKQQSDALITPQQQEALRACQQSRGGGHGGGGHLGGGHGAGPCGEMPGLSNLEKEPNSKD